MPLILADSGYDVWMGNNRGTEYSRGNTKGLTIDQQEFWAWDWGQMGIYDDPVNIEFIKSEAEVDKIFYVGYSQGTVQMFYGLIKEKKAISDSLHKYVALAPCTISISENTNPDQNMFKLMNMGIYALWNTPTWADDMNKICTELDPAQEDFCNYMKQADEYGFQTVSVQDSWYWQINYDMNRFQEYAPEYLTGGPKEMPLLDLSTIKAPEIAMFVA